MSAQSSRPFLGGNLLLAGALLMLAGDFMFALNDAMGKWLTALLASWGITSAVLLCAPAISRILKEKGAIAIERLMGMLLVMISVQMFLNGLERYMHR